jgi:hypothetical protein
VLSPFWINRDDSRSADEICIASSPRVWLSADSSKQIRRVYHTEGAALCGWAAPAWQMSNGVEDHDKEHDVTLERFEWEDDHRGFAEKLTAEARKVNQI